jgi:hypothetical protein
MTLQSHQQDLISSCGILLDYLSQSAGISNDPSHQSVLHPTPLNFQICEISRQTATFSYLIAISPDNKCFVALNSNVYVDKLLELQYPVDIFKGISSGTTVGNISGQLSTFPRYFPFATILNLVSKFKLGEVIVTGVGWSGTLAHVVTFILRELGRSIKVKIPIKCISYSGPLCASQSFHSHLQKHNLQDLHLTINYHHYVFDRILMNYQQLSLLTHSDIESWRPTYEILFNIIVKYQHVLQRSPAVPVVFDLETLLRAEELLTHHSAFLNAGDDLLQPIGSYLFQPGDKSSEFLLRGDGIEISKVLRSLDNFTDPADCLPHSELNATEQGPRQGLFSKEISLKPVLNSVNVIKYSQRSTLIFDGTYLDCTLGREARNEILLENETENSSHSLDSESMPFFMQSGSYEIQPGAKILFVRAMGNKVIIDISGFVINSPIQIGIRTDFGDSNCVTFDPSKIILKDETSPISLHPVMNSSFLLGALLRVALCYRECHIAENLRDKYPFIFHLWVLLLDLERICPLPNPLLDIQMQAYVNGQFDLIILKNVCSKRMEDISLYITTLENDTEGPLRHGARTMLGGLSRLTGGLITTAGVILTVPSMLLSLPAAMYVANQNRNRTDQQPLSIGVGTGLYLGVMGLLSLPGVFVAGLGAVLSSAGSYAMKDKESINYKNILYTLLSLLGESNQEEIVDEITPLENHVLELFSRYFPQCNLLTHSPEEIYQAIQKESTSTSKGPPNPAVNLMKYFKKNKNIFMKLKLIFKIHHIRKLMENNLFITFLGVNNAKKSVILHQLFEIERTHMKSFLCDVSVGSDVGSPVGIGVGAANDPSIHQIGLWLTEQEGKNEMFQEWMSHNERKMLQIYAIDYPYLSLPTGTSSPRNISKDTAGVGEESSLSPAGTADSSSYSVELSSIFIILLTEEPHEISAESMRYVDLAKSNHKPYLVLVDLTSSTPASSSSSSDSQHVITITTPGQYESYKESYSRELDIPVDLIHFTNPHDPNSTDKLRGLLFGMVQNLIASPYMSQVLALKFLPSMVVEQLISSFHASAPPPSSSEKMSSAESSSETGSVDSSHGMDILSIPDILAMATSSLLYNLCSLNSSTIRDSCRQLLTENSPDILKKSDRRSTIQSLPFGIHLQSQQIAFTLSVPDSIYLLFSQILSFRLKLFKEYLKKNQTQNIAFQILGLLSETGTGSKSQEVDNMLSVLVLTFIRQQINEYLEIQQQSSSNASSSSSNPNSSSTLQPSSSNPSHPNLSSLSANDRGTNIQYLCTEILLGLQMWINLWSERGYPMEVVSQAVEVTLSETGAVTNSRFLQILNRLHTRLSLLEATEESTSEDLGNEEIPLPPLMRRVSSHTAERQLLTGFQLARDQYTQIMKILSYQPFPEIVLSNELSVINDHTLALQRYNDLMREYNKTHTSISKISLTTNTNIVLEVIDRLMSLTSEELKKTKLLFSMLSESAVDVNGVTRSVLTQVAKEINENPSIVLLKKDEQSNLIFFDPDACSQTDPTLRQHVQHIYTGFGRLIGLCLIKASVGVTLPIDLPLTFYRLILGYRLSMSDLFLINPQIATSLSNICLMDQETLEFSGLDFTVTRNDHTVYELTANGSNHSVTIQNRVEYIRTALQYYLCSRGSSSSASATGDTENSAAAFSPLLSFLIGIQSVCSRHYFHHFNPISLQLLLEGNRLDLNVVEWRTHTEYRLQGGNLFQSNLIPQNANMNEISESLETVGNTGVISTSLSQETKESGGAVLHPTIEMFWEVVSEMDEVDKRRLLCFSVGTTSLPSNGFSGLQPKFTLVVGTLALDALPISHTCFHMLILPKYESKDVMREKVLQAIRETGVSDMGIV